MCEHLNFVAEVDVNRLSTKEDGRIDQYSADVRIKCAECDLPFRFIGLPAGLDLNGAATSVNAEEARLAIAPKGQVISVMENGVSGFSIRNETRFTPKEIAAKKLGEFLIWSDTELSLADSQWWLRAIVDAIREGSSAREPELE